MLPLLYIALGLLGLWLGTRWIINSATDIAARLNLSPAFVGLAILAVGTDLPEIFVSIHASLLHLKGVESSGIIVGNALGSCISQITLILGVAALFSVFTLTRQQWYRDGFALLMSILLLFVFGLDGIITRLEGTVMILSYALYYYLLTRDNQADTKEISVTEKTRPATIIVFLLLLGFATLIYSAHLVVNNTMLLAERWGVTQSFLGVAIIGLGTSLPELAVSIGAAFRKSTGMAIGNIIGSNIFDGFIPVGLGGTISTINVDKSVLIFDLPALAFVTLLVLLLLRTKRGISRREAVAMIGLYFGYIAARFILIG